MFLRFSKSSKNRSVIESFLFRYFLGYKRAPARMSPKDKLAKVAGIDAEEVFTFLSERARAPSTSPQLRAYVNQVWDALMEEIGSVFSKFPANTATRKSYRTFTENHLKSRDAVVSFNYDLVFEKSLPKEFSWAYQGVQDTTNCFRIIKPHGSINWESGNPVRVVDAGAASRPVIVAPTHLKFVATTNNNSESQTYGYLDQSKQIQDVWADMEQQMRDAKALVFIGYSFPVADLYFSSILRSVLADREGAPDVVLVNPDAVALGRKLQSRFAIGSILRFFDLSQFVQSNRRNLLESLRDLS